MKASHSISGGSSTVTEYTLVAESAQPVSSNRPSSPIAGSGQLLSALHNSNAMMQHASLSPHR